MWKNTSQIKKKKNNILHSKIIKRCYSNSLTFRFEGKKTLISTFSVSGFQLAGNT